MNPSGSPSQSPMLPKPGTSKTPADLAASKNARLGRYVIVGRLGAGGMGVVYEAEDSLLHRRVAIKLLPREVSTSPEALKRFLREARSAASLNHPNVVAIYDIGETADHVHYIVMELIKGCSAEEVIRRHGPFPWPEATRILAEVCQGVSAAHQAGLIHRDIKPANILRSSEGIVKLGDFGLVKAAGRKGTVVTALGDVLGTPHYMSPEQANGGLVDERSDIYALGATYFTLLTGRPPFPLADTAQVLFAQCSQSVPDPRDVVPGIPKKCSEIIRSCMAKNRGHRPASVLLVLSVLEDVLKQIPGSRSGAEGATAPFVWETGGAAGPMGPPSLATKYPAERTEGKRGPRSSRRTIALAIVGLALSAIVTGMVPVAGVFLWRNDVRTPEPGPAAAAVVAEDWPTLAASAEAAIRARNAASMKASLEKLRVFQKRLPDEQPLQLEAIRKAISTLEKSITFRERITEKGLVVGLDGHVTSVVFSPDDRLLFSGQGSGGGGAIGWDSYTGEKRFTLWPRTANTPAKVQSLAFSHDSGSLAAAFIDPPAVRVWELANAKEIPLLANPANIKRVLTVSFAPTTRDLVAGFEPFTEGRGRPYLKIWNLNSGREPFAFKAEHSGKIASVAFAPGGEQVATASHDRRVILWNADTGRVWRELRTGMLLHSVACAPQGRLLVATGLDKESWNVQFWDYAGERVLATRASPHGACRCAAFSRDGTVLAVGSGARVLLWNPETQELLAALEGHGQDVTSLAFAAEGGILASGSDDQTVRLWDVARFSLARIEP